MVLVLYMQKLHLKLEHVVPREYSTMTKSNCNIQLLLQHQTLTHLLSSLEQTSIGIRVYDSGRKLCIIISNIPCGIVQSISSCTFKSQKKSLYSFNPNSSQK